MAMVNGKIDNDDVLNLLIKRTQKSHQAYEKAKKIIPAGVVSRGRLYPPYPFFVKRANGCRIIDYDDNEYIDCATSYGAAILGHCPPVVVEAITKAVKIGQNFCMPHELTYRLAQLVVQAIPGAEKVTFCNSGTEATLHAIRIARAFSGKDMIAKFEGGYHGDHDYVLVNAFSHPEEELGPLIDPRRVPDSIGIPQKTIENTLILPFNHGAAFDRIKKYKDKIAVVMIEALQGAGGCIPVKREFLQELRKTTKEYGILLLFDEVFTGFRLALGGAQEFYGVIPDIATYGKALGGGLPIGCIAGKEEVMDIINYSSNHDEDSKSKAHFGGTFNGNVIAMAAGCATLEYLTKHKEEVYPYLDTHGKSIRDEINKFCQQNDIPAQAIGEGSIFYTHFVRSEVNRSRDLLKVNLQAQRKFFLYLLKNGVFIPFMHLGMISFAHKEKDVQFVINAHLKALKEIKEKEL